MLEPTLLLAVAAALFLVPFDILIGGYLLLVVNLEAYRFGGEGWSLSVESLATAVVACRTLIEWCIDPRAKPAMREGRWLAKAIALFVIAGAISALFSIDPLRSWKAVIRYSTYPVVVMGILRTGQRRGTRWIRNVCLASAVIPCVCSLMQVYQPDLMFGYRDWKPDTIVASVGPLTLVVPRVNGTLNTANALAMYLLVIAGWGLSSSAALTGRKRPLALLLGAAFCCLMIFLTFCRAVWVGAVLLVVVWAALNARLRVILCTVLSFGLIIAGAVQSGMVTQRFADIQSTNNSLTWRVLVWKGVLDRQPGPKRLLVGYGLDTMILDNDAQPGKKAHSAYVAAFHDCGLAGLTALIVLLAGMVGEPLRVLRAHWTNKRLRTVNAFALLIACGFVFLSLTEEPLALPTVCIYFWTALAICRLESVASTQLRWRSVEHAPAVGPRKAVYVYDAPGI